MRSNQMRLWRSTFAYMLMRQLRATAMAGTRLCSACPASDIFAHAQGKLRAGNS